MGLESTPAYRGGNETHPDIDKILADTGKDNEPNDGQLAPEPPPVADISDMPPGVESVGPEVESPPDYSGGQPDTATSHETSNAMGDAMREAMRANPDWAPKTVEEQTARLMRERITEEGTVQETETPPQEPPQQGMPPSGSAVSPLEWEKESTPVQFGISPEEFERFKETGDVPETRLDAIADKIASDIPLTREERYMYRSRPNIIEGMLLKKEAQGKARAPEGLDDVSDEESRRFVETGEVSTEKLNVITEKIALGLPISPRERDMYNSKADIIENMLTVRRAREEQNVSEPAEKSSSMIDALNKKIAAVEGGEPEPYPDARGIEVKEHEVEHVVLETPKNEEDVPTASETTPPQEQKTQQETAPPPPEPPPPPESAPEKQETPLEGARSFEQFGISTEEISRIEGFSELTIGQRLLVAENLKQITLGRIQEEAQDQFKQETKEAKFFGRIWKNISKTYQIAKHEKAAKEDFEKGGIAQHGEIVTRLVRWASEGPGVEILENGELELQYAPLSKEFSPEQTEKAKHFNTVANAFSRIPHEWAYVTADSSQRKTFEQTKQEYEAAKKELYGVYSSMGPEEMVRTVAKLDRDVAMNQFLNTHPDAEEALMKIENEDAWKIGLKRAVTERALYAGMGALGRTVSAGLLGVFAAPVVASAIGGWRAHTRAKETLVERDVLARRGVEDTSAEARNIVDGEDLRAKIERTVNRINETDDPAKKQKLTSSLLARVEYTQGKIDAGLINFGSLKEDRINNQYELLKALSFAKATASTESGRHNTELEKRLDQYLEFKDEKISSAQKTYVRREIVKGATMGAAYAGLGYAITDIAAGKLGGIGWWGSSAVVAETGAEAVTSDIKHVVESGDNVWNIVKENLSERGLLKNMNRAEQTYLIDSIKDEFAALSPEELKAIGISSGNVDMLEVGDTLDLSRVLGDKEFVAHMAEEATTLPEEDIESIAQNLEETGTEHASGETVANAVAEQRESPVSTTEQTQAPVEGTLVSENISEQIRGRDWLLELGSREMTEEEYAALYLAQYDKLEGDMNRIFSATQEEQMRVQQEDMQKSMTRMQRKQFLAGVAESRLPWKLRGMGVSTAMMNRPNFETDAFEPRITEWTGVPDEGVRGIRDMSMEEISERRFASGRKLDEISANNRKQLLVYIGEMRKTLEPNPKETAEQYILRALALRDTQAQQV